MEVRKLTEQEHFESNLISYVAFHMRMEDPEKVKEESKKLTIEDWGAFSEDGRIMARILNHRFDSMLTGRPSPTAASAAYLRCRNTGTPAPSGRFLKS